MTRRTFWIAAAALLAAMAAVEVKTTLGESQTWDEAIHLATGYAYWKTGDFRWNFEHPPLFKLLATLPLLPLAPRLPMDEAVWKNRDQVALGNKFLYENRVPADILLFRGRAMSIALTAALGLVVAAWTRKRFGGPAALLALFLFASDPSFLANGHLVTNDVIVTLFLFLAVVSWARFLETARWRDLALAGVTAGLAMVSKFSAAALAAILPALYAARWRRRAVSPARCAVSLAAVALIGTLVVAGAYGPETVHSFDRPPINNFVNSFTIVGQALEWMGTHWQVPPHPFLLGLNQVANFSKDGHDAYLLGQHSKHGWWYYYPVAFAVKTPTAVVALLAACAVTAALLLRRGKSLTAPGAAWATLVVPVVVYFGLCLLSPIDLGLRYLLPVYPFLFVLIAAVLFHPRMEWHSRTRRLLLAAAVGVQLFECIAIYPDYLAFFNTPSGGPDNGPRYLADSNIDWGQDVKKLKTYLDTRGWKQPVCLSYFGMANMTYYGVPYAGLPTTDDLAGRQAIDCVVAISATQLVEAYQPTGRYAWLRQLEPTARVGHSIYLYDLRKGR